MPRKTQSMRDAIEQSQRELAAIRDYHQNYLDRRRTRGVRTSTDMLMEQHQEQLARTLDLLEALKANPD
jgi:hypothetical protein